MTQWLAEWMKSCVSIPFVKHACQAQLDCFDLCFQKNRKLLKRLHASLKTTATTTDTQGNTAYNTLPVNIAVRKYVCQIEIQFVAKSLKYIRNWTNLNILTLITKIIDNIDT